MKILKWLKLLKIIMVFLFGFSGVACAALVQIQVSGELDDDPDVVGMTPNPWNSAPILFNFVLKYDSDAVDIDPAPNSGQFLDCVASLSVSFDQGYSFTLNKADLVDSYISLWDNFLFVAGASALAKIPPLMHPVEPLFSNPFTVASFTINLGDDQNPLLSYQDALPDNLSGFSSQASDYDSHLFEMFASGPAGQSVYVQGLSQFSSVEFSVIPEPQLGILAALGAIFLYWKTRSRRGQGSLESHLKHLISRK